MVVFPAWDELGFDAGHRVWIPTVAEGGFVADHHDHRDLSGVRSVEPDIGDAQHRWARGIGGGRCWGCAAESEHLEAGDDDWVTGVTRALSFNGVPLVVEDVDEGSDFRGDIVGSPGFGTWIRIVERKAGEARLLPPTKYGMKPLLK